MGISVSIAIFLLGAFAQSSTSFLNSVTVRTSQATTVTSTSTLVVTTTRTSTYIPPSPESVEVFGFAKTMEYRTTAATGLSFQDLGGGEVVANFAGGNYTAQLMNGHTYRVILYWSSLTGNGRTTCDTFTIDVGFGTQLLLMDWAC